MADEELHPAELGVFGAAGVHEVQRPLDLGGQPFVALTRRRLTNKISIPTLHLTQISTAVLGEGSDEVQRGRAGLVDLQHPARIGPARGRLERQLVDRIAVVGREFHPIAVLYRLATRLEVLTRHPTDLDHRQRATVGEDDRHLQHRAQPGLQRSGGIGTKRLGAVSRGEHEGFAALY